MSKSKIKVLLVDDHPIVLTGISTCLKVRKGIKVVGKALTGEDAIKKARMLLPDVIVMDISLPEMSGLEVLKILRLEIPGTKVLVHSMHKSMEYVHESMKHGASGYVVKDSSPKQLAMGIKAVQANKIFLSPQVSRYSLRSGSVTTRLSNDDSDPTTAQSANDQKSPLGESYGLTKKEKQVLELMVQGLTIQQIATNLKTTYNTMTSHFKHIYGKLQVHNRGSAVAKAFKENLL